jgi:hypothetical protein
LELNPRIDEDTTGVQFYLFWCSERDKTRLFYWDV